MRVFLPRPNNSKVQGECPPPRDFSKNFRRRLAFDKPWLQLSRFARRLVHHHVTR